MGKKQELNDTKIKCIGKITKTKSKNINSEKLIDSNQENIIIETNEFEDVDVDVDVDEDEDEVDELDDDDEDEELDELDDALSEGGSIDEVSDSESLLSDLSDNSKLMD